MSGKIVIDGSWQGDLLSDPVSFQVENGIVVDVWGDSLMTSNRCTNRPKKVSEVQNGTWLGPWLSSIRDEPKGNLPYRK